MKRKVFLILIFLVSLILFDRLFSFIIFESNSLFFRERGLKTELAAHLEENDYNALIMGSSRTYEGIHPSFLKSGRLRPFKWSFAGFGPKYNYHFYRLFRDLAGRPELAIIGVDYFIYTLYSSPAALAELGAGPATGLRLNYLEPALLLMKNKEKADLIVNDIKNSLLKHGILESGDIERMQTYQGSMKFFSPKYRVDTKNEESYRGAAFTYPPGSEGNYFFDMLDEMKRDNVRIILAVIPEYIGTFRTNRFQRLFRLHLKEITERYDNVSIRNYNYIRKFDLGDPALFLDGGYGYTNSHLSRKGAEILNGMLKKDLRQMGY